MERPSFLGHLDPQTAIEQVQASAVVVLPAFVDEGIILTSELEFGYEDLPLACDVAAELRGAFRSWHRARSAKTDFRTAARAFAHAFHAGVGIARQIREQDGDGVHLDLADIVDLDGDGMVAVPESLSGWIQGLRQPLAGAFVSVQDKQLVAVASTKNDELLDDFFACACLWSCLAGVEAGLEKLDAT